MNNNADIRNNRVLTRFRAERAAHARELRHAVFLTAIAATVFAIAALIGSGSAAAMQLNAEKTGRPQMMAYAEPLPERFGLFDGFYAEEEEGHPMNDAWMGMTVVSADGVVLGYVIDAFVMEDGSIDEIVIEPAGNGVLGHPVYVPIRLAELGAEAVSIAVDAHVAANLEPATDLVMAAE